MNSQHRRETVVPVQICREGTDVPRHVRYIHGHVHTGNTYIHMHMHMQMHIQVQLPPSQPSILLRTASQLPASSYFLVHFPVFPLDGASLPGSLCPEGKDHKSKGDLRAVAWGPSLSVSPEEDNMRGGMGRIKTQHNTLQVCKHGIFSPSSPKAVISSSH